MSPQTEGGASSAGGVIKLANMQLHPLVAIFIRLEYKGSKSCLKCSSILCVK
jgi:hypothetical protein